MKATQLTLLIAAMLCLSLRSESQSCEGQPILFEDFNLDTIPPGWTVLNLDTNTLYFTSNVKGYTGEWQHYNHFGRKCVTNCSRFNNSAAVPDDYLVTPLVHIGTSSCLSWKSARAYDYPAFSDEEYEILVSTTGANVAGFQMYGPIFSFTEHEAFWTLHNVDLSSFAGIDVNIGFHHITPGFGYSLSLDDIRIAEPVTVDGKISGISVNDVILPGTNVTISGELFNGGLTTIHSATLNWKINNGNVNSYPVSALIIPNQGTYAFIFPQAWNAASSGTYILKVWADNVNGTTDQYHENDTLIKYVFVNTKQRKVLQEEFTQASCPPCGDQNPAYDALLAPNRSAGKVTMLKYHVGWPGVDPMYDLNPEEATDRVISLGITGVPCALSDGVEVPTCVNNFPGAPNCLTQNVIDAQSLIPSMFNIDLTSEKVGNDFHLTYEITALSDFPLTSYRVYAAVLEDLIDYGVPPGTNGESEFPQVMRKMVPSPEGVLLPPMAAGQSFFQSFTVPILPDYDETALRVIAFVEDNSTRIIYQSEMTDAEFANKVEMIPSGETLINLFPVPASDKIWLSVNADELIASIEIINSIGEKICTIPVSRLSKKYSTEIDTRNFTPGVYFLLLKTPDGVKASRFLKQ